MVDLKRAERIIYRYWLNEDKLPPGTTEENWMSVLVGDLHLDDPPADPGDPDISKRFHSLRLKSWFWVNETAITSPLEALRDSGLTLGGLAEWCFNHQGTEGTS